MGWILPESFDTYVRVLHPPVENSPGTAGRHVRWSDVAREQGTVAHAAMEWVPTSRSDRNAADGSWAEHDYDPPSVGCLPDHQAQVIARILRDHTPPPHRCGFGIWSGYSSLALDPRTPRAEIARGSYYVCSGDVLDGAQSVAEWPAVKRPNYWWAPDQRWCLVTDIDLMSTYVGSDRATAEALLAEPTLEVYEVPVDQKITWDADTVNM